MRAPAVDLPVSCQSTPVHSSHSSSGLECESGCDRAAAAAAPAALNLKPQDMCTTRVECINSSALKPPPFLLRALALGFISFAVAPPPIWFRAVARTSCPTASFFLPEEWPTRPRQRRRPRPRATRP